MRVVVVGGGIVGLCTAWRARRAGHEVTLVERGPLPNPLGSSVDEHRLIRYPYGTLAGYGARVADAYAAWEALWADLGERLYVETGTLVVAGGECEWARRSKGQLAALGIAHRELAPAEVERAFPHLRAGRIAWALHSPTGGVLLAGAIVAALGRWLEAAGAVVRAGTHVAAVDLAGAEARLASGEAVRGDALVVAAGPWVGRLVPDLAARVTPSRQVVVYVAPPPEMAEAWARSPMVLDIGEASGFYAVPPVAGRGLKLADHRFSLRGDPDRERAAGADEAEAVLAQARGHLAHGDAYRVLSAKTCFYTVAPEERFVVEVRGRSVVISACSGHGFKFGAWVGGLVVEALGGERDAASLASVAAGLA